VRRWRSYNAWNGAPQAGVEVLRSKLRTVSPHCLH